MKRDDFGFFSKKKVPSDGHYLVGVWGKSELRDVVIKGGRGQRQRMWSERPPEEGERLAKEIPDF